MEAKTLAITIASIILGIIIMLIIWNMKNALW